MYRRYFLLLALALITVGTTLADVAPPPGYVKVSRAIILHTDDDLSAYRFFLVSSNLVREVVPVKGQTTTVSSLGGGARYSSGTLFAIPKSSVAKFTGPLGQEQMEDLSSLLNDKKIPGSIELASEGFSAEVKSENAGSVTDPEYRLSKTAEGIKAEKLPSVSKAGDGRPAAAALSGNESAKAPLIASGLVLAGLAVGAVIWRRRAKAKNP